MAELESDEDDDEREFTGSMEYFPPTDTFVYALRREKEITYLTSDKLQLKAEDAAEKWIIRTYPAHNTKMSKRSVRRFLAGDIPSGESIYERICEQLNRYIYWEEPELVDLLAHWVMATYCFKIFSFFPYVAIWSKDKRCGKSTLLHVLTELAYMSYYGTHLTPAVIFRETHPNSGTMLMDEMEYLRNCDKETNVDMFGILNEGYWHGGATGRCEPDKHNRYSPTRFYVYGPKVFAGINQVGDTIRDRSLKIWMARRPRGMRRLPRFDRRGVYPTMRALRNDLYIWAIANAKAIAMEYKAISGEGQDFDGWPEGLDDRAKDLGSPLVAIAKRIGTIAKLCAGMTVISRIRKEDDKESEGQLPAIKAILQDRLNSEGEDQVLSSDGVTALLSGGGIPGMEVKGTASGIMERLGFRLGAHRDKTGKVRWGFKLNSLQLNHDNKPEEE